MNALHVYFLKMNYGFLYQASGQLDLESTLVDLTNPKTASTTICNLSQNKKLAEFWTQFVESNRKGKRSRQSIEGRQSKDMD